LPIIIDANFELKAGSALAIIEPSGSGKSTLARALVGVLPPARGSVRLDGAALDQWDRAALGRHLGYMPQDLQLLDGTVAETISRFDVDAKSEDVIAAAEAAGAHELIVSLPQGSETRIGEGGAVLSAGQRQRLGLARALYGSPFLVVLDEPNSNLDAPGEEALARAITSIRARGGLAVLVTHRPSALQAVDKVALVMEGRIKLFGPRDEVMRAINEQGGASPRPARPVAVPQAGSATP
jgi:ATP-binding cassette subfamily C protein